MAFRREDKGREPAPPAKPASPAPDRSKGVPPTRAVTERLASIDAYRGLTMLLMASGGFGIAGLLRAHPEILKRFEGGWFAKPWTIGWQTAASQLQHVEWTGCTVWDLIQPSFMFIVGVAMPFSYAARTARGDSWGKQLSHALVRSLVLILLGIFLRSTGHRMTYFTFEDVLTQIGLGYLFVFLLVRTPFVAQLVAVLAILGGYWFFFYHHPLPPPEGNAVIRYMKEVRHLPASEWNQFTGLAAHWNKHTNAAADFDRKFLNFFPREGTPWEGKKFWINGGGYQTLNFVPSMATMIFGLMAGQLLRSSWLSRRKLQTLLAAGAICFIVSMAIDTTIWPMTIKNLSYSFGPVVKRIWTPSWAVFAAGWTFWFLALFYWLVDMRGHRRLAFPLAVVGMNSIAVYVIADLAEGWLASMLKIHLTAFDAAAHTSVVEWLYNSLYSPIWRTCAVLLLIWLICLWLHRRRIFIRI